MAHKRISVGVIQANPIVGDIQGNLNLAISAIEDIASKEIPDIFLLTEMFIFTLLLVISFLATILSWN